MPNAAMKPAKTASHPKRVLRGLPKICPREHKHLHLTEGRAKHAAFCPMELADAIMGHVRDTAAAEFQKTMKDQSRAICQLSSERMHIPDRPDNVGEL